MKLRLMIPVVLVGCRERRLCPGRSARSTLCQIAGAHHQRGSPRTPDAPVFRRLRLHRLQSGRLQRHLLGQVVRPALKSDAENAVKHIEGVDKVDNQIEVLPPSSQDDRHSQRLFRAIYQYPALQRYELGVQKPIRIIVKNGRVTLEGVVDSEADKNLVGMRANGVSGIFSVTNNLQGCEALRGSGACAQGRDNSRPWVPAFWAANLSSASLKYRFSLDLSSCRCPAYNAPGFDFRTPAEQSEEMSS